MALTITSDLGVVLLAAGRQERFGGFGKPKCFAKINGVGIYERLREKLFEQIPGSGPVITVVNDQWEKEDLREVEPVAVVRHGLAIGSSIAVGLRALIETRGDENGHALIMAADTWIPENRALLIPPWIGAIIDPWAWISIYRVGASEAMAAYFEKQSVGRIEYVCREGVRVWLRDTGYCNVNTPEDLQGAQKGEVTEWCGL
jgi:CTP:molybdopterin cytidylyltransferase MocA